MIDKDAKLILVNSHRRSGTHLLIDSLRKNIEGAKFPNHFLLPADFNLGTLFAKKKEITKTFQKIINSNDGYTIIKSHLLPEECNIEDPRDEHECLIREIFDRSKKLNVYRDGKDVLSSLYKFIHPSRDVSFLEFLNEENDHIPCEIREKMDCDSNRIMYWKYHVDQWKKTEDTLSVEYGDLKNNFATTMANILKQVGSPLEDEPSLPKFPKYKLFHNIRKRLNHYGLAALPESSSVRPRKGKEGDFVNFFDRHCLDLYNSILENK